MAPAYSGQERRRHYRIRYPVMRRPRVQVWGQQFDVIDVSESGVRFQCPSAQGVTPGQAVQAVITFDDAGSSDVEGLIVRIEPKRVAVAFTVGIPYSRIVREQLHLLNRSAARALVRQP